MACCLMAPSHYLNQCWLLISEILWHSPKSNFTASTQTTSLYNEFEKYTVSNICTTWINVYNQELIRPISSWHNEMNIHEINGAFPLVAMVGATIPVPCQVVQSVQLIWRSGNHKFHLWVPNLTMSCNDLYTEAKTKRLPFSRWHFPIHFLKENAWILTSHCLNKWWLVYWRICASLSLNVLS